MNDLQIVVKEQNIAGENAKKLIEAFGAPFEEAGEILATYKDIVVRDESEVSLMTEARTKRLALKKIRTGVENKRKELKEDALRAGQAIDGVAKYIKENIQPAEEYLELQEKFAEIKKAERAAEIKAKRIEQLSAYSDNLSAYNLDGMNEETFSSLLAELKGAHEAKIAKEKAELEAAEKAEAERIAEERRIREENERLRKEAEEKEAALEAERKAAAAKQAKINAEKEKELAVEREKAEAERAEKERLIAEQKAKDDAIAKEKAVAEEAERRALLAPDKEKILQFNKAIELIRIEKLPAVKTKQAQDVVNLIDEMLEKMSKVIVEKAKNL